MKDSELIVVDGKTFHLGLSPEQLARNLFVVGDPERADKVAAYFDAIEHRVNKREFITRTGTYRGMPVSVIATGIGTDNIEIALVEAYELNEFDLEKKVRKRGEPMTIIRIGTSGGLQKDVQVGALAISSYALGLDSTGLFYQSERNDTCMRIEEEAYRIITDATSSETGIRGFIRPYASKASVEVVEALKKQADNYVVGITASSSGFHAPQGREIPGLRITVPKLQEHLATLDKDSLKVVNMEMESSLMFRIAKQLGYRCGSVCAIIGNRFTGEFLPNYGPAVERAIKCGLEAMVELAR
jgi:uridine phosphorylase